MNIQYAIKLECFLYKIKGSIVGNWVRSGTRPYAYSHPNNWLRKRNKKHNYGTN